MTSSAANLAYMYLYKIISIYQVEICTASRVDFENEKPEKLSLVSSFPELFNAREVELGPTSGGRATPN